MNPFSRSQRVWARHLVSSCGHLQRQLRSGSKGAAPCTAPPTSDCIRGPVGGVTGYSARLKSSRWTSRYGRSSMIVAPCAFAGSGTLLSSSWLASARALVWPATIPTSVSHSSGKNAMVIVPLSDSALTASRSAMSRSMIPRRGRRGEQLQGRQPAKRCSSRRTSAIRAAVRLSSFAGLDIRPRLQRLRRRRARSGRQRPLGSSESWRWPPGPLPLRRWVMPRASA